MSETEREYIINVLLLEFSMNDDMTQREFIECPRSRLSMYHHGLGSWIRNQFNLWSYPWTPVLVDGVDMADDHPDAVSMSIIEEVWDRIQEMEQTQ